MAGILFGIWLGRVEYSSAHRLQLDLVDLRARGDVGDHVLLLEHDHVFTLGRKGGTVFDPRGVPVYRVERGGYATYHGPGQLVGYPIIDLSSRGLGVVDYIRLLERAIIRSLEELRIRGERVEGFSGVWAGGKKIASIGIAVKNWITYHGFAVNLNPDLGYFDLIDPCGLGSGAMTSAEKILGRRVDLKEYAQNVFQKISEELGDKGLLLDLEGRWRAEDLKKIFGEALRGGAAQVVRA